MTRRDLRESLAESVECCGYTAEQLEPLLTHIVSMAGQPGIGCGEVVNLLRSPERLQAAVEDWQKRRGLTQLSPGEAVRRRDMERRAQFDKEWEEFLAAKRAGKLEPLPARRMPWER